MARRGQFYEIRDTAWFSTPPDDDDCTCGSADCEDCWYNFQQDLSNRAESGLEAMQSTLVDWFENDSLDPKDDPWTFDLREHGCALEVEILNGFKKLPPEHKARLPQEEDPEIECWVTWLWNFEVAA